MKIKFLFLLLVSQFIFSQHRTCGKDAYMQNIMSNPILMQQYLDRQQRFEVELQKLYANRNATSTNTTIIIPVAVHFPSVSNTSAASLKTCFRNLAQSQIDILNADYNALNSDLSNWINNDASLYPMVTNYGSFNVQFVLATQNHPAGTGIPNGTAAVTFGTDFLNNADNDTTWSGYLNLVCRNAGSGILGYSPLGGSPSAGDTVVIAKAAFGSGSGCTGYVPGSPYNLGRTLTHELGHFFNLDHTFAGCDTGSCSNSGDNVCDTPACSSANYNCPDAGSIAGCVSGEAALTMNYMDYVNDACMYMFTLGQTNRMIAYYNTIAAEFKTNVLANDQFKATSFSIFPNPNKGNFTIQFTSNSMNNRKVEVIDLSGRVIFENIIDQTSFSENIQLINTETGVYIVSITDGNNKMFKKIIIE